jgi:chorismate mutase/prephenate dehydratase
MALAELRAQIDAVDDQILRLLNERAALVRQVSALKERHDIPFYVPSRERQIVERLVAHNPGPFPSSALQPVFQEIFSACLTLESVIRVAYLGPEGTFTHQAVRRQFGTSARSIPCGTIGLVFAEVERGGADFGVVPIENSTEGVVNHTLDTFIDTELSICAEIALEVSQCLLVKADLEQNAIRRVYSHPQALGQCRRWITGNLPQATLIESPSTAEAARLAREDSAGAAIGSEMAARLHDLIVLRRRIEDAEHNVTRFLLIGRRQAEPTGRDKTSILVSLGDRPGSLFSVLQPFAANGVNLTRIESRPAPKKSWEYIFFIDVDGHVFDPPITKALAECGRVADEVKVLGSYPKSAEPLDADVRP